MDESVNGFMLITCWIPVVLGIGLLGDVGTIDCDFPCAQSVLMWILGVYLVISAGHYGLIFKRNLRYHSVFERIRSTGRLKTLLATTGHGCYTFIKRVALSMFAVFAIMCCIADFFRDSYYFIVLNYLFLASLPVGTYACVVAGRRLRIALWKALSSE